MEVNIHTCSLLKDKIGVVTGSTRGIGFAIAREFAENNGATTIVCSRIKEQAIKSSRADQRQSVCCGN